MLVLSRRPGEVIHIGDDIQVMVISARKSTVRLGIIARKDVPVQRQELYERMQSEEQALSCIGKEID